jgi:hypothetical protein
MDTSSFSCTTTRSTPQQCAGGKYTEAGSTASQRAARRRSQQCPARHRKTEEVRDPVRACDVISVKMHNAAVVTALAVQHTSNGVSKKNWRVPARARSMSSGSTPWPVMYRNPLTRACQCSKLPPTNHASVWAVVMGHGGGGRGWTGGRGEVRKRESRERSWCVSPTPRLTKLSTLPYSTRCHVLSTPSESRVS